MSFFIDLCVRKLRDTLSGVTSVLAILAALLILSGCVSSTSNTATYGGPSVSTTTANLSKARGTVRDAKKELRALQREIRSEERSLKRDERKFKRKSTKAKQKKELRKDIRSAKRNLRKLRRSERRAERKLKRAERKENRARNAITAAKKRLADARRKESEEKRRKAKEARLAKAEARKSKSTSSFASGGLFALSDPALKNINDYRARIDGSFPVVAIPVKKMNKRLFRQEVRYLTRHKKGTIVVDTRAKYLYLVLGGGKAMRYGIGVGKAGFEWSGSAHIGWKQQWPKWTPPSEMIERRPELEKYSAENGGMPGGPQNPLGARALYLMQGNVDTLYRLHGTPQWASIGTAASSGCIRLMNQDIIDLYNRVPNGTRVVVI